MIGSAGTAKAASVRACVLVALAACVLLLAAPFARADLVVPTQTPPRSESPSPATSSAAASPAGTESDGGSSVPTAALVIAGVVAVVVAAAAFVGLRRVSAWRPGPEAQSGPEAKAGADDAEDGGAGD
jgi:hypothetical protein